jgi:hypothetical protein
MTDEHMWGRSCVMRTYRTTAGPINLAGLIIRACAFPPPRAARRTNRVPGRFAGRAAIATDIFGIRANKQSSGDCEKLPGGEINAFATGYFGWESASQENW